MVKTLRIREKQTDPLTYSGCFFTNPADLISAIDTAIIRGDIEKSEIDDNLAYLVLKLQIVKLGDIFAARSLVNKFYDNIEFFVEKIKTSITQDDQNIMHLERVLRRIYEIIKYRQYYVIDQQDFPGILSTVPRTPIFAVHLSTLQTKLEAEFAINEMTIGSLKQFCFDQNIEFMQVSVISVRPRETSYIKNIEGQKYRLIIREGFLYVIRV